MAANARQGKVLLSSNQMYETDRRGHGKVGKRLRHDDIPQTYHTVCKKHSAIRNQRIRHGRVKTHIHGTATFAIVRNLLCDEKL